MGWTARQLPVLQTHWIGTGAAGPLQGAQDLVAGGRTNAWLATTPGQYHCITLSR